MKKFTKFMLSVAAMAAVSASLAVSAMAADTVTGTYDKDTGVVALSNVVSSGDQQTLLVLNQDVTVTSANASAVIAQIDQAGAISEFVLPANLTSGTYYIRIGGSDGTIQTGTLTIAEEQPGEETVVIYVGDVDGDDWADTTDAIMIMTYDAWGEPSDETGNTNEVATTVDGDEYYYGDVDGDGWADTTDAIMIMTYDAWGEPSDETGSTNEELEIVVD